MNPVYEDEDLDYLDVLDVPPCPRCRSATYGHDRELKAWICEDCGLYVDDDDPDDYS